MFISFKPYSDKNTQACTHIHSNTLAHTLAHTLTHIHTHELWYIFLPNTPIYCTHGQTHTHTHSDKHTQTNTLTPQSSFRQRATGRVPHPHLHCTHQSHDQSLYQSHDQSHYQSHGHTVTSMCACFWMYVCTFMNVCLWPWVQLNGRYGRVEW